MSTLVVEDGSGTNPLANTYAAVADLVNFALQRSASLPVFAVAGESYSSVIAGQVIALAKPFGMAVSVTDSAVTPATLVAGYDFSINGPSSITINNISAFTQPFLVSYSAAIVAQCEVLLLKAMDYLEDLNFKGFRFKQLQALKWPRYDVIIDGWPLLINQIPAQLLYAQCALAIEYQKVDLLPTFRPNEHGSVLSEEISGATTETYADNARVINKAAVEKATRFIRDIVRNNGMMVTRT